MTMSTVTIIVVSLLKTLSQYNSNIVVVIDLKNKFFLRKLPNAQSVENTYFFNHFDLIPLHAS